MKSVIERFNILTLQRTQTKTSPTNYTNIYKAYVKKVSLDADIPTFVHSYTGRFLHLRRVKFTVDHVQVENRLTFATD